MGLRFGNAFVIAGMASALVQSPGAPGQQPAPLSTLSSAWAAQSTTIPERLVAEGRDIAWQWGVGSGVPPTLSELLMAVDQVVRGVVGSPRSYLSDDRR